MFPFFFPERFLEIVYHLWALNSRETQSMYYALQIGLLKDKAGEDSFFSAVNVRTIFILAPTK